MNWKRPLSLFVVPVLLAFSGEAQVTHQVTLEAMKFTPSTLKIDVGDTVQWVWVLGTHDVKSGAPGVPDGTFDSGLPTGFGTVFSVTFDAAFLAANPVRANLYPYYCTPHFNVGMIGSVQVQTPATSTTRNGTGVNPAGFVEITPAVIGGVWQTTVDIVTPSAFASAIAISPIGPLVFPTSFGQLLVNISVLAGPIHISVTGAHDIPIPGDCNLIGLPLWTQAATIKSGVIQFQNAIDIVLGN